MERDELLSLPGERRGDLLMDARRTAGLSRRAAAHAAGVSWTALRSWERGTASPSPADLDRLLAAFGTSAEALLPERTELDFPSAGTDDPDDVVEAFVELVRALRQSAASEPLQCRTRDLETLAGALALDVCDVEARIARLTGCTPDEAARLHRELIRRRLLIPVAGVALGATALAAFAFAGEHDAGPTSTPSADPIVALIAETEAAPSHLPATIAPPTKDAEAVTTPTSATVPEVSVPAPTPEPEPGPAPEPDVFVPEGEVFVESPSPEAPAEAPAAAAAPAPDAQPPHDVFIPEGEVFVESPSPSQP